MNFLLFWAHQHGSILYAYKKFINIDNDIKTLKKGLFEHIKNDENVLEEIKERLKVIETDIKELLKR